MPSHCFRRTPWLEAFEAFPLLNADPSCVIKFASKSASRPPSSLTLTLLLVPNIRCGGISQISSESSCTYMLTVILDWMQATSVLRLHCRHSLQDMLLATIVHFVFGCLCLEIGDEVAATDASQGREQLSGNHIVLNRVVVMRRNDAMR